MSAIGGVFCLRRVCVCDKETGDAFHRHADWSDITGSYNTADTVVKDRRTK